MRSDTTIVATPIDHCTSLILLSAYSDPKNGDRQSELEACDQQEQPNCALCWGRQRFVDFLFHILALPVGQVIQLLTKTGTVGSLGNLCGSVEKLNNVYIKSSKKDILLKPKAPAFVSELPFLLPDTLPSSDSRPEKYYRCLGPFCGVRYVGEEPSLKCPGCGLMMNKVCKLVKSPAAAAASAEKWDGKGSLVLGEVTYMVMDDLTVKPTSAISSITMLKKFNVEEIGLIEEKVVSLGTDEGIKLLRSSFHSKKVLTDVFLGVKPDVFVGVKRERS